MIRRAPMPIQHVELSRKKSHRGRTLADGVEYTEKTLSTDEHKLPGGQPSAWCVPSFRDYKYNYRYNDMQVFVKVKFKNMYVNKKCIVSN